MDPRTGKKPSKKANKDKKANKSTAETRHEDPKKPKTK